MIGSKIFDSAQAIDFYRINFQSKNSGFGSYGKSREAKKLLNRYIKKLLDHWIGEVLNSS
jgi:hypothetical protein